MIMNSLSAVSELASGAFIPHPSYTGMFNMATSKPANARQSVPCFNSPELVGSAGFEPAGSYKLAKTLYIPFVK